MTELDLEAIKARCEAATPGPWHQLFNTTDGPGVGIYKNLDQRQQSMLACRMSDGDQIFVAHARADVPALVAEVERLREALMRAHDKIGRLYNHVGDKAFWAGIE